MTIRATTIRTGTATAADTITLDEDRRHRRRMAMVSDHGIAFLLDLPEARLLEDGDGLELEDGRIIRVVAAPEPLYEVRGTDPHHLLRLAWHMGNRHLPAEILDDRILIRRDHVIRAMLEGLGASIAEIEAPFSPEGGAYGDPAAGHGHGPHHHHHHSHHD